MKNMTSDQWHEAVRKGLQELDRRLADGTLDQSGRFYTDEELDAQRAALAAAKPALHPKAPAA
jgi:hypothetical protein